MLSYSIFGCVGHDGEQYPLALLYQLCCGLLSHLHVASQAKVNIFKQAEFHVSHYSEMKRLNTGSTGIIKALHF